MSNEATKMKSTTGRIEDLRREIVCTVSDMEEAFGFDLDQLTERRAIRLHERLLAVATLLQDLGDLVNGGCDEFSELFEQNEG